MATSFSVNLGIQSVLGFKRPSGAVEAPRPIMQTTQTLDGVVFADLGMTEQTRVLIVDPIDPYVIRYETTSSPQTVILRNFGNSTLTVDIEETELFSLLAGTDGVDPVFYFTPAEVLAGELQIPANSTASFGLAYYGREIGTWSNTLLLVSDIDVTYYKVNTFQTVANIYDFDILPPTHTQTISVFARSYTKSFTIDPYQGVTESISAVTSGAGYSIDSVNTTTVVVKFDPSIVNNDPTGSPYIGELTVTANSVVHSATLTSFISLTPGTYENYGSWLSPVSYYNSVVGISYDNIDGRRTLTIGIGTGGDDINEYARGGAPFADLNGLGISGSELSPIYPYWSNVYRIPLNQSGDIVPRVYETKDYLVKQLDVEYGSYFGDYASQGSMFIVHDDGRGNLRIEMNRLRALSTDEDLNATLQNLSRAFYYYSGVDVPSRFPANESGNIDKEPFTPGGDYKPEGNLTRMFLGFLRNGNVVTTIVDIPIAD
jgi:hypothetical protein